LFPEGYWQGVISTLGTGFGCWKNIPGIPGICGVNERLKYRDENQLHLDTVIETSQFHGIHRHPDIIVVPGQELREIHGSNDVRDSDPIRYTPDNNLPASSQVPVGACIFKVCLSELKKASVGKQVVDVGIDRSAYKLELPFMPRDLGPQPAP
jgi:hypothetical protein